MVWDWITRNWKQLMGLMQDRWDQLSHHDLMSAAGKRERLIGLLQARYGCTKAEAESDVDDFISTQSAQAEKEIEVHLPLLKS